MHIGRKFMNCYKMPDNGVDKVLEYVSDEKDSVVFITSDSKPYSLKTNMKAAVFFETSYHIESLCVYCYDIYDIQNISDHFQNLINSSLVHYLPITQISPKNSPTTF